MVVGLVVGPGASAAEDMVVVGWAAGGMDSRGFDVRRWLVDT